jgi:hypothetical protein
MSLNSAITDARPIAGQLNLPLTFSVTKGREDSFLLSVIGYGPLGAGGAEAKIVENQSVAIFATGKTLLLQVFLGHICFRQFCTAGQVCQASTTGGMKAGACRVVPVHGSSDLATVDVGKLPDLTQLPAGVVTIDGGLLGWAEAGPDSNIAEAGTPAASNNASGAGVGGGSGVGATAGASGHSGVGGIGGASGVGGSSGAGGASGTGVTPVDAGAPTAGACDGYDAPTTLTNCFVGDCKDSIRNNTDVATCVTTCFNKAGAPAACCSCAGGAAATTRAVNCMSLCDTGAPGCPSCMAGQDFTSNLPTCGVTKAKYTQKDGPCGSPDDQDKASTLSASNMTCVMQCQTELLTGDPTTCMSNCYKTIFHFGDMCVACLGSKTMPAKTACTGTCITNPPAACPQCISDQLAMTQPACVGK